MFSPGLHMGVIGVVRRTTFKIIFSTKNTDFQNLMFKGKILVGALLDQTLDFQFILTLTLLIMGFSNRFQTKATFFFPLKSKPSISIHVFLMHVIYHETYAPKARQVCSKLTKILQKQLE